MRPQPLRPLFALLAVSVLFAAASCRRAEDAAAPPDAEYDHATGATPTPYDTGVFEPLAEADRTIIVHCGNSMRPATEALAAAFQKVHGIGVQFNFGGSSELIASIELGQKGDLYIPHDPYAVMLAEKGLLDRYEVMGYLEPIIIVPPGNPKGIESLRDLAQPGLKVGMPDPRYATAGKLALEAFEKLGIAEQVQANMRMEGRSHNDVAVGVKHGHMDAGLVWNFIARFYEGRLERVAPGVEFPETRVTLCLLTTAQDKEAAEKFMEFASTEHAKKLFELHGYTKGGK